MKNLGKGGFGGSFGGINRFMGPIMKLIMYDATTSIVTNVVNTTATVPPIAKTAITLGLTMGRIPILKKLTKGMPFGLSALINTFYTISAIQNVMTLLPTLTTALGGGGTPGGVAGAPGLVMPSPSVGAGGAPVLMSFNPSMGSGPVTVPGGGSLLGKTISFDALSFGGQTYTGGIVIGINNGVPVIQTAAGPAGVYTTIRSIQ